jgi:uncharacterized damage-inducible protein DinB
LRLSLIAADLAVPESRPVPDEVTVYLPKPLLRILTAVSLLMPLCASATAQSSSVVPDLIRDVDDVGGKLVDLANAIPAESYDWRPGDGVRSVAEVLKHVAADNYLIPAGIGYPAPTETGINGEDYRTAVAFEERSLSKEQVVQQLTASFEHLRAAMQETESGALAEQVGLFGMNFTRQQAWILATTHLHEHLGQAIAYARINGVVPPWSM